MKALIGRIAENTETRRAIGRLVIGFATAWIAFTVVSLGIFCYYGGINPLKEAAMATYWFFVNSGNYLFNYNNPLGIIIVLISPIATLIIGLMIRKS